MRRVSYRSSALVALAAALTITMALDVRPSQAEDEDRRVVKTIRVHCEDSDCADHEHHGDSHAFVWSGGGPHRFRLGAHAGGGFLGVQLAELTPELRTHFGVSDDAGVMISRVIDDSPAARAGLRVGDIVTAVDGESIDSGGQLGRAIRHREEGETVLLEVWRDGSVQSLTATVEDHQAGAHGMEHAFVLECDDDGEDCSFAPEWMGGEFSRWDRDFDCGGDGPCEVNVTCDEDDACTCTVNGEETDCSELPGFDR